MAIKSKEKSNENRTKGFHSASIKNVGKQSLFVKEPSYQLNLKEKKLEQQRAHRIHNVDPTM